jgi:hypothetical protein
MLSSCPTQLRHLERSLLPELTILVHHEYARANVPIVVQAHDVRLRYLLLIEGARYPVAHMKMTIVVDEI